MFFDSWDDIGRTIVVGFLAYAILILLLRVSGKRTLAKMNAFDLVVTVALGSTLATILLSKEVSLAEGVTAFLVLVGAQYIVAWASVRSESFANLVKSEPVLLLRDGRFLDEALRRERVTRAEIVAAIREHGIPSTEETAAVILETDGSFTALARNDASPPVAAVWHEPGSPPGAEPRAFSAKVETGSAQKMRQHRKLER